MTDSTLKAVAGEEWAEWEKADRAWFRSGHCAETPVEAAQALDAATRLIAKLVEAVELDKEAMRAMAELLIRTPQTPHPDEADINRYLDGVLAIAAREGVK